MPNFDTDKKRILSKSDNSKKGSVDTEIRPLIDFLNSLDDYYTTSSCAGRIVLLERGENIKLDSRWLLASHDEVDIRQVKEALKNITEKEVWLKQESWIIHLVCRNVESASKILQICLSQGLKRSGITSVKKKVIVEIMSSENLSAIVAKSGSILVSDDYLSVLIDSAINLQRKARSRLKRFEESVRKEF